MSNLLQRDISNYQNITELNKKATIDKFVSAFISKNLDNLDNKWRTTINVEYNKEEY